eukprot:6208242-Pleurochrysis_carterae.AAC.4
MPPSFASLKPQTRAVCLDNSVSAVNVDAPLAAQGVRRFVNAFVRKLLVDIVARSQKNVAAPIPPAPIPPARKLPPAPISV